MAIITDLPYELISTILSLAAAQNEREIKSYTYGLSELPKTSNPGKFTVQKHLRGRVPNDFFKWNSVDSIRRTCHVFHMWALEYAAKEVFVKRWRGGESWDAKWLNSDIPRGGPSSNERLPVVYKDPYRHVRNTANLVGTNDAFAASIRRLCFSGIYIFDSVKYVYEISSRCDNLRNLSVPWTTLRYWSSDEWARVLSKPRMEFLEFTQVDMRLSQCVGLNMVDTCPLRDPRVDWSKIRKLKIRGTSNVRELTDADLVQMSKTMRNLRSLQIIATKAISWEGVLALVAASAKTLHTLVFTPESFPAQKPQLLPTPNRPCSCSDLQHLPHLSAVTIQAPTLCPEFFKLLPKQEVPLSVSFDDFCATHKARSDTRADAMYAIVNAARKRANADLDMCELKFGRFTFFPARGVIRDVGKFKEEKKKGWAAMTDRVWEGEEVAEGEFWEGVRDGFIKV